MCISSFGIPICIYIYVYMWVPIGSLGLRTERFTPNLGAARAAASGAAPEANAGQAWPANGLGICSWLRVGFVLEWRGVTQRGSKMPRRRF